MNGFASSKRLRYSAKRHLSGNYNAAVSATVTIQMISTASSVIVRSICNRSATYGAILFYIIQFLILLLMALFSSGQCYLFLNMCCGRPVTPGMVFYGCTHQPEKAVKIQLFQMMTYLICALPGSILLGIGSVTQQRFLFILSLPLLAVSSFLIVYCGIAFSQSFYLLHDFPNNSAKELLEMSCRMMKGHKIRYLALLVSFIPLYLAAILSFGVGFLWVLPYVNTATTEFFLDLMNHKE